MIIFSGFLHSSSNRRFLAIFAIDHFRLTYRSQFVSILISIFNPITVQLEKSYQAFQNFYTRQHCGRVVNWLYHMSKTEIVSNCFKSRYTFQVIQLLLIIEDSSKHDYLEQASTFQMAILLQYNCETSHTVQHLAEVTKLKMDILLQVPH